jgi:hypothetical protein
MQPYFRWLLVVNQLERKTDVTLPSSAEFKYELSFTNSLSNMGFMEMMVIYVFFCTFAFSLL